LRRHHACGMDGGAGKRVLLEADVVLGEGDDHGASSPARLSWSAAAYTSETGWSWNSAPTSSRVASRRAAASRRRPQASAVPASDVMAWTVSSAVRIGG